MKKSNTKKLIARIACAALASLILTVTIGSTISVKAAVKRSTNSYNSAIAHQIAARTLKQCIENQMPTNAHTYRWSDGIIRKNISNGDIFETAHGVNTGPWFENKMVGGGSGDGSLNCSANSSGIVRAFADQFTNGDVSAVMCGANGTPGLVKSVTGFMQDTTNHCGEDGYQYILNENSLEYIESLYNQWLNSSEDATDALWWDGLDNADFSDQELYYLVYNDMAQSCGVSGIDSGGGKQVTYVDESGKGHTMYMNSANPGSTWIKTAYINDNLSCNELADMLNQYAQEFLDTTVADQGQICYESWTQKIDNITNQAVVDAYKGYREQATRSGDYSIFYDKQNDKCIDIDEEKGEEIEEVKTLQEIGNTMAAAAAATGENDGECFNHGTDALGHVICPVVKFMREAISTLYDYVIVPFLELDSEAFKMDSPAFTGWQTFQSVANIAFVIFLLVIIFSQITGVGIDNYGIKRMLPKLIIAAVLVNLSYIICQLAVDASNLIGFSLNNLFQGMANTVMESPGTNVVGVSEQTTGGVIIAGALGIGGAATAIATAEFWLPSVLIAAIPGMIAIIFSILFMFVLLGARQAAAVILVVISPLAFVCYTLPNTKKLFDRWLSAFKAILLLFPICGLLMGGGAFAGALLWNVSDGYFLGQLLAALMTVIPFFFIPRVLKASLNAVGSIGNMISNAGNMLGRGAGNAIRNSDGFKAAQRRAAETSTRRRAGLDSNYQTTFRGNLQNKVARSRFGRFTGYGRLQAERLAAVEKARQTDIAAQSELQGKANEYELANQGDSGGATSESLFKKNFLEAQHRGDMSGMFAAVDQAKKAGVQSSHMAQITRNAFEDDNFGGMSDGEKSNFLREFGNRYGNDFLRKDFEQAQWARMGGMTQDGSAKADLRGYAGVGDSGNISLDDLKDEDVAALSGDRMSELMTAGKIGQQQAQRVWSSNQNMDDTERLILGAYKTNGTVLTKKDAQKMLSKRGDQNREITLGTGPNAKRVRLSSLLERSPERVEVINVPHGPGGGGPSGGPGGGPSGGGTT